MACLPQSPGDAPVIQMPGAPAIVADQKNAVVAAAGMGVDEIGVGAFDAIGEIGAHEKVEDAVDRVGRNPLTAQRGDRLGQVVGRPGRLAVGERTEHVCTHLGPLFAGIGQDLPCGGDEPVPRQILMAVSGLGVLVAIGTHVDHMGEGWP